MFRGRHAHRRILRQLFETGTRERRRSAPVSLWSSVIRIVPGRLGKPKEIRNIAGDMKILAYLIL